MEQFGKFELIDRLGQGGMAEVFLARPVDVTLAKLVAIKRINSNCIDDEMFSQMFQREAEIALRFRHPGIVAVHEFGSINKIPYMSMEYLSGKTLAELILFSKDNRDAIDMGSKLLIIKTITDALHYIHEFSDFGDSIEIIHRDISPHNILVGFDGRTKLIDFGIAKINEMNGPTRSRVFKGKVAYMSPEQSMGDTLTHKTDIFSLGIVLWELLCGRKLFTGTSVGEIGAQIQRGDIPPLVQFAPDAPVELRTVCRIALSVDPQARYKSAKEMGAEIEQIQKKYYPQVDHRELSKKLREIFPEDFAKAQTKVKAQSAPVADTETKTLTITPDASDPQSRAATVLLPDSDRESSFATVAPAPQPLEERFPNLHKPSKVPAIRKAAGPLEVSRHERVDLELMTQPRFTETMRMRAPRDKELPSWITSLAVFFMVISICMLGRSLSMKKRVSQNQSRYSSSIDSQPAR